MNDKIMALTLVLLVVAGGLALTLLNDPDDNEDDILLAENLADGYTIVDTGQTLCYGLYEASACPTTGNDLYGQDAQYQGTQASYQDNGDGTVTDLNTGLMWQQDPGDKMTFDEAMAAAQSISLAGYDDWRLPTIKELYSLIDFSGKTGMSAAESIPYIDTDYFDFEYGDENAGERFIDAQYFTSTEYVGTTMHGDPTVMGVNFADGRIKGYPMEMPGGEEKEFFVMYVRGNDEYGENEFIDNDDETITDNATELMWLQADSGTGLNWTEALAYAENFSYAGYDDWRLPNAKELQSIVDYSFAPDATDAGQVGPAIDDIFDITENTSHFWTGTTHVDGPDASYAVYMTFGLAEGWMEPPSGGDKELLNVHGAGSQRSDPKEGDPDDYPEGHGPQGDVIGIYNYVRLVRNV